MATKQQSSRELVATNVRRLREAKGLSQSALARRSKLRPARLSLIEGAKHDPQCETLDRLAKALDVTPADLLEPPEKS